MNMHCLTNVSLEFFNQETILDETNMNLKRNGRLSCHRRSRRTNLSDDVDEKIIENGMQCEDSKHCEPLKPADKSNFNDIEDDPKATELEEFLNLEKET